MTKSAGEHWVCSVLSRHGWAVALTRDGLERTDILAVQTEGSERQTIELQVKSLKSTGSVSSWPISVKAQRPALSPHEWCTLVLLDPVSPLAAPRTFVMPRDHVAAAAWIEHLEWLYDPTVPAGKRNVGVDRARLGLQIVLQYEDRWDLLGTPTDEVPVMLPQRFRELALDSKIGLPPDHPWKQDLPEWWKAGETCEDSELC